MVWEFKFRRHLLCYLGPNIPARHACETCHVSGPLFFYQGLVCTSSGASRSVFSWRSCIHNRSTLQNEPVRSWQVHQGIFSKTTLLFQAKMPKLMPLLYSLLPYCPSPSHPHDTLLLELQIIYWHLALPLPHLSTYPAAAHHHSWRRRGCRTVSSNSNEEKEEDQQVLILFTRPGEPNSVEFTGSCAR